MKLKSGMKAAVLFGVALTMMGNEGCEDKADSRSLRRRVQMGQVVAPPMPLPEGGTFDFQYAANAQLFDVLNKTKSFTTSTISSEDLDLEEMTQADRDAFNSCHDDIEDADSALQAKMMSKVATCMVNMPQAVISSNIVNFELTTAAGLTVGLPQFGNLSGSFDIKKATLTMAMKALDPLIPGHVKAANTSSATRSETNLSATINLGGFSIGPRAYFKSDLAKVVNKAMENGIVDLKSQFDRAEPWFAMVKKNCDKAILINGGSTSDVGLQVGDILEIHNVWYDWEGKVCDSRLRSSMQATPMGSPIAVAQVTIVGDTMSQAHLIEQTGDKIQPGARVYVRKLFVPTVAKKK